MKAREVAEKIEAYINELGLKPGDRLPTEDHLMEKFGLTRHRTRLGIAFLQREKGFVTIRGSGTYIPGAPETPKPKEKTIAVIDPCGIASQSEDLHIEAFKNGYRLLSIQVSHESSNFERVCLESIIQRPVVSLCLEPFPIEPMNFDLIDQLIADGVKVLLMNAPHAFRNKYSLFLLDYRKAGYMAASSMMGKGLKKIYLIRSSNLHAWQHQDFENGVHEAATDYSLEVKVFHADTVSNPFPTGNREIDVIWTKDSDKITLEPNIGYISDGFSKGILLYSELISTGIPEPSVFATSTVNLPSPFPYALLDAKARLTRMLSVAMDKIINSKKIVTEKFAPVIVNPAKRPESVAINDSRPIHEHNFQLSNAMQ